MKKLNLKTGILLLVAICTLFSCEDNNEIPMNENHLLIGNWVHKDYNNDATTFSRVNNLPDENYGISFKRNGDFIERSSGFCGTPPLTFFNIEGSWELDSIIQVDSTIVKINKHNWQNSIHWKILSLTKENLVIETVLTDQETNHKNLMDLFDEIYALSTSISCTDSNDWNFTAYGTKACGGPQGYIAYSNQIDTALFLEKVATYTETENLYNIKWGIVSDCSVPPSPITVACENGVPVLKY